MEGLIRYGFISIFSLGVLCFFYFLVLKNSSNFQLNRIYLLFSVIFTGILPFIKIRLSQNQNWVANRVWIERPHESIDVLSFAEKMDQISTLNYFQIVVGIYFIGLIFFIARFVVNLAKIKKLMDQSGEQKYGGFNVFIHSSVRSPFSFFKYLFINKTQFTDSELVYIYMHEKAHSDQKHSLDLILFELVTIINWFNPFVYYAKKMIKETHEYLADAYTLDLCTDRLSYQKLICKHNTQFSLLSVASGFKGSILKKRLLMMQNRPKQNTIKYLMAIPVICILILLFAFKQTNISSSVIANAETNIPKGYPVDKDKCEISSGYGWRIDPISNKSRMHNAIDFRAQNGLPIITTGHGIVVRVDKYWEKNSGYGRYIVIDHQNGYETWYTHLSGYNVEEGMQVSRGDIIGFVGNTGLSTGPHVHYEIRKDGQNIDPTPFIE